MCFSTTNGNFLTWVVETLDMIIEILKAEQLTDEIQLQVTDLYRQLNSEVEQRPLSEVLNANNNVLVTFCKENENILGIALLSTYKVISGYRALVEDVVVNTAQRGKGIGRKLMEKLLEEAKAMGVDEVLLFTGHHRKPAIGLYTSLGFELRRSGIYNKKLT